MKLYLASTSPRRKELLQTLGIPFEVIAPIFKEEATDLRPEEEVLAFAEAKARSVASRCLEALVIGSDTLVVCDGKKFGKPRDIPEARRMLEALSGRTHEVLTAVVLLNTRDENLKKHLSLAKVRFRILTSQEIDHYIATGEPMDKAGAYAVQGKGSDFIASIEGDVNTVIGLTLEPLRVWLLLT